MTEIGFSASQKKRESLPLLFRGPSSFSSVSVPPSVDKLKETIYLTTMGRERREEESGSDPQEGGGGGGGRRRVGIDQLVQDTLGRCRKRKNKVYFFLGVGDGGKEGRKEGRGNLVTFVFLY